MLGEHGCLHCSADLCMSKGSCGLTGARPYVRGRHLAHHVSSKGICPSEENVHAIVEFPMPETYTEVRAFCGLAGHYSCFIRNFVHLACVLYDILDDEVKMGPVTLTPKAQEAV